MVKLGLINYDKEVIIHKIGTVLYATFIRYSRDDITNMQYGKLLHTCIAYLVIVVGRIAFADINTMSIFLTQYKIWDIDILCCSTIWPTHIFHYRQQSSQ